MSSDSKPVLTHQSKSEAELIDCLLAAPTLDYPWDTTVLETADYYVDTDSYFSLDNWSDQEIAETSVGFFAQIQSCWANSPAPELELDPLVSLTDKFGTRVPQEWLKAIATQVKNLASQKLEPIDRLVHSVKDLLLDWAADDLLVMARPYAYAMRCDPGVNDPTRIVRDLAWTELSELERAKLTILIAQYAIDVQQS